MAELTIDSLAGPVAVPDSWLAFVVDNEGTLLLEYRDGSPQRHIQVEGVGIGEVAEALSQWSRGERGFLDGHQWTRLTDGDQPEDGSSTPT